MFVVLRGRADSWNAPRRLPIRLLQRRQNEKKPDSKKKKKIKQNMIVDIKHKASRVEKSLNVLRLLGMVMCVNSL